MARVEVFLREWGSLGSGDGQFNVVISLAVQGDEVYVTDFRNDRVQVFDRGGAQGRRGGPHVSRNQDQAATRGSAGRLRRRDRR